MEHGIEVIRRYTKNLPQTAGVYRMFGYDGEVLYVGKAKNLKARVTSYSRPMDAPRRIQRMIGLTKSMEFIDTRSEAEALLLEASLIKSLKPRFNVDLKDDKTFAEILLTGNHDYPRIQKHRGTRKLKGDYFGPFASTWSVNEMLYILQRVFLLRTCSDNVFTNRSRPCLLHQIKRCSAPCVNLVSKEDYILSIDNAKKFLKGDTKELRAQFSQKMNDAAQNMAYEEAAVWRDRLRAITNIQAKQSVNILQNTDIDVVAIHLEGGRSCVQVFFFRGGRNYGTCSYFPKHDKDDNEADILAAFLSQFYARHMPPSRILVNILPHDDLEEAFSERRKTKVKILRPERGELADIMQQALGNARAALGRKLSETSSWHMQLSHMSELLGLSDIPNRIEVYDNSHTQGSDMIGAMIVAGHDGFEKAQYRKYNIKDSQLTPGDDFAMMKEVFMRRFLRMQKEEAITPDLVLIDGGKGQLSSVMEIMDELGVSNIDFVAVSKGVDRHAGKEQLHLTDGRTLYPEPKAPALWMIQKLRDEAHRFAIGVHRKKRAKSMRKSGLDVIAGIGAIRKRALMAHFGSLRDIKAASVEDIASVEGISLQLAETILEHLNNRSLEP